MKCISRIRAVNGSLVACGKCLPCRVKKQTDWTVRMNCESRYWDYSSFLTLTYNNDTRPVPVHAETGEIFSYYSLNPDDLSQFIRLLRQYIRRHCPQYRDFSFYACGEYSPINSYPHYHIILFGIPATTEFVNIINRVWHKGFISLLPVKKGGFEYVAKHQNKYDGQFLYEFQFPPFNRMTKSNYYRPNRSIGERYINDYWFELRHPLFVGQMPHDGRYVLAPRYFKDKVFSTKLEKENIRYDYMKRMYDRYGNNYQEVLDMEAKYQFDNFNIMKKLFPRKGRNLE